MSWTNLGFNIGRLVEDSKTPARLGESLRILLDSDKPEAKRLYDEFSLKECADQLLQDGQDIHSIGEGQLLDAVNTTAFSIVTSELLSKTLLDAYKEKPSVLDELVRSMPSKLLTDKVPGIFIEGDLDDVAEGMDYPQDTGMADKYVQVEGTKRGKILNITEEAVMHDQTGTVMLRAADLGRLNREDRERRGIWMIMDITNSGKNYYSWRPAGTRTALWANAGGSGDAHEFDNLITDQLEDYTDLDAAKILLGTMKDDNGQPISVTANVLLVPVALETTGRRLILNSTMPGGANSAETNPFFNTVKVIPSAYIDGSGDANAATNWWWGDFKAMFYEKVVFPLQLLRQNRNSESNFNADIIARFKVRSKTEVFARDYRFIIKSSGTVSS